MNAVELVKQTCKEKGISIAKMERDLDFSNGYIGKIKKEHFPAEKAVKIAEYLGLDFYTLVGFQEMVDAQQTGAYFIDSESVEIAQKVYENPDLRLLFDAAVDSKPEDIRMAADLLSRFKEKSGDE